jgi:ketosteroid isomerase-like protein
MLLTDVETTELDAVRALERRRIEVTRMNDAEALEPLLDEHLIYVNSAGEIDGKPDYLRKIRTNCLSYDEDFDVRETEVRVLDNLIIFAGVMLGHSRLQGEQQVLRFRSLAVWRKGEAGWRMIAWQSSSGNQVY